MAYLGCCACRSSTIRIARSPAPESARSAWQRFQKGQSHWRQDPSRERDYIDALMGHVRRLRQALAHPAHPKPSSKAMEALAAKYPTDDEAQIRLRDHAECLGFASRQDLRPSRSRAQLFLSLCPSACRSIPGVTHYLIHLYYDYPERAAQGIEAANRYGQDRSGGAARAAHAVAHLHFASAIGMKSIASNIASVRAAQAGKEGNEQLHGEDYMVYALPPTRPGQGRRAPWSRRWSKATNFNPNVFGASYALGRFARACSRSKRKDWGVAAELPVRPTRFQPGRSGDAFSPARLGAAHALAKPRRRQGRRSPRLAEPARQAAPKPRMPTGRRSSISSHQIATGVGSQRPRGKHDEALESHERRRWTPRTKTDKSAVTAGTACSGAPSSMARCCSNAAWCAKPLVAYEATKAKEPNPLSHGFAGAAAAAEKLGDKTKAKDNYQKLV